MKIQTFKHLENASKYHKKWFTKSFDPNGRIYKSFHLHIGRHCFIFNFY